MTLLNTYRRYLEHMISPTSWGYPDPPEHFKHLIHFGVTLTLLNTSDISYNLGVAWPSWTQSMWDTFGGSLTLLNNIYLIHLGGTWPPEQMRYLISHHAALHTWSILFLTTQSATRSPEVCTSTAIRESATCTCSVNSRALHSCNAALQSCWRALNLLWPCAYYCVLDFQRAQLSLLIGYCISVHSCRTGFCGTMLRHGRDFFSTNRAAIKTRAPAHGTLIPFPTSFMAVPSGTFDRSTCGAFAIRASVQATVFKGFQAWTEANYMVAVNMIQLSCKGLRAGQHSRRGNLFFGH